MEKFICDEYQIFNLNRLKHVRFWPVGEMNLDFDPIKDENENYLYMHAHTYTHSEKYSYSEQVAMIVLRHTYNKIIEFLNDDKRIFDMSSDVCLQRCFDDRIINR